MSFYKSKNYKSSQILHTGSLNKKGRQMSFSLLLSGAHLWPLRYIFGAVAYEADGLHAGVRKRRVADKL